MGREGQPPTVDIRYRQGVRGLLRHYLPTRALSFPENASAPVRRAALLWSCSHQATHPGERADGSWSLESLLPLSDLPEEVV